MQTQRINITLPNDLARDLRRAVPVRSRSRFIAEAVQDRLAKKRNLKKDWIKSLKTNAEIYKQISDEIDEDFKYADAEIIDRLS